MSEAQSPLFFLVDDENIHITLQQLQEITAEPHHHAWIFIGAGQNKLDTDLIMAMQALGDRGKFIRTLVSGKNALDFHLVYVAGQLNQAQPEAAICILSADKDYDPLVEHLQKEGVKIQRQVFIEEPEPPVLSPLIQMIIELLQHVSPARPKSVTALSNWLHAKFPDHSDQELISAMRAMEQKKVVEFSESKVIYSF